MVRTIPNFPQYYSQPLLTPIVLPNRPDLRQALIRDSMVCDPETLGTQMIGYLKSKWEHRDVSDAIASTNIADIVQRQAEQRGFWAIDQSFYSKHSRYSACNLFAKP